jgi:hypothetical protein
VTAAMTARMKGQTYVGRSKMSMRASLPPRSRPVCQAASTGAVGDAQFGQRTAVQRTRLTAAGSRWP